MRPSGSWRNWFPVPSEGRSVEPARWLLLEGNRHAVTTALLSITFVAILAIGQIWTFEMQRLLNETPAVETVLNTFLGGIILLVSIVVSINSVFISYDITSIEVQEERLRGTLEFRREIGHLTDTRRSTMDPESFLTIMIDVINQRSYRLESVAEELDGTAAEEIREITKTIRQTTDYLENSVEQAVGGEFGVLWIGLEMDFGPLMAQTRALRHTYADALSEEDEQRFESLIRAFELVTMGRHYFKTLYYSQEFSRLSRTLLLVSLPAILVTATTILAINAQLLPRIWIFGLSPVLTFVAAAFAVALAPFLVLTAYMLRVATVALRTSSAGPFILRS